MKRTSEPELVEILPDPTDPDERRAKRPKRRHRIKRVVITTLIVLLLAVIAGIIFIGYNLTKLSVNPFGFGSLTADSNGRTNILILGIGDPGHAGEDLSDSMMLLSIDKPGKQVAMISIPRDLQVSIPGYGISKINAANSVGGHALAEQTVSSTLNIPINYYITIDFSGLEQLVNAVGGIDVTVTQPLVDPEYPCSNNQAEACGLDLQPGNYHMNGAQALEYTRCRKGTCGNDFGRDARQQEVLQKLRAKIFTPAVYLNPKKDSAIVSAISANAKTDLTSDNLIEVGWALQHSKKTTNFVFSTAPGGFLSDSATSSNLVPTTGNFDAMQQYVHDVFN